MFSTNQACFKHWLRISLGMSLFIGGSFVGAAGASEPVEAKVAASAVSAAPVTTEPPAVAQPRADGAKELWNHLFGADPADAFGSVTLDFRAEAPGVFPGSTADGATFTLVALEVTPIDMGDPTFTSGVNNEDFARFTEADGNASLVFGLMFNDNGARYVLGTAANVRHEEGWTETVFVPLATIVSIGAGQTCENQFLEPATALPVPFPEGEGDGRTGGAWGYCRCVAHVLKCELYTAGCIAAVPAAIPACAGVCAGSAGLGCVACIIAAAAGFVAVCEQAYDCWVVAQNKRCV